MVCSSSTAYLKLLLCLAIWKLDLSEALIGPSFVLLRKPRITADGPDHNSRTVYRRGIPSYYYYATVANDNVSSSSEYDMNNESDRQDDDDKEEDRPRTKKISRWDRLDPKIKARIVKEAHARAIANKKKREPIQEKKRSA